MTNMQAMVVEVLNKRPVGKIDLQAQLRDDYELMIEAGADQSPEYKYLSLSAFGGGCPVCGKEWRKKEVNNAFAKFYYFVPSCSCYPLCPYCGKVQMVEVEKNYLGCLNCMYHPIQIPSYVIPCNEWLSEDYYEGRTKRTRRKRCKGVLRPIKRNNGHSHKCTICDREVRLEWKNLQE